MDWDRITQTKAYKRLPRGSAVRVYLRIMQAAAEGTGVQLSADETFNCSLDNAIESAAIACIEEAAGQ